MELEDLIASVDILEYVSQYVELEEKGGEYWGLSPLKDENTPSFSIRRETQSFYDFSSGKGGNVLNFIYYYNHCHGYGEAIRILKKYAGYNNSLQGSTAPKRLAAVDIAKRFSVKNHTKKESKSVILPDDYMSRYDRNLEKLSIWREEGISQEAMDLFEVKYDKFSDRIVYPIKDILGNIINVSGRTIDPEWKQKGLRKYTYFKPLGFMDVVYGLSENIKDIIDKKEIILFEGAKSVMKARSWGINNCGAILTSHLNNYQKKILAQIGCRAVFALDKDVDISEDKHINSLKRYVRVEHIKDIGDLLKEKDSPVDEGMEVFEQLYNDRQILK